MEMIILKVEEIFFRDMYHQICLLTDAALAQKFIDMLEMEDEKPDGLLAYGYIDKDAGFTFSILGGAKTSGGKLKIFPINYKAAAVVRRGAPAEADVKILTDDYALAFRDRMQMINDTFAVDDAREQTRFIKNLDAFRHPDYPDDVVVYFFHAEDKPELLWVRCLSVDENILNGELLNEPTKNFGCHAGDKIKFGVAKIGEQNILLHLPTTEAQPIA